MDIVKQMLVGQQHGKSRFMQMAVEAAVARGENIVVMTAGDAIDGRTWLLRLDNQRDAGTFTGEGW